MVEVQDINKLNEAAQRLKGISDSIDTYDIPRTNFSAILEDERLLAIYHKDWIGVSKQIQSVKMLRERFLRDFQSNPELAISNIKTHLNELIALMQLFDPKEISKLQHAILMLSRLEIAELNKCIEDVNRWPNYRLTNRIDFFVERLVLYLKGGRSRFDGAQFSGLYTHFRDVELKEAILRSGAAKKLLFYKKEQEFFSDARSKILRSIREGGWEEFYEFYNNLKKGRNYIKMVRETFGNEEFANFLEALPKEVHENPTAWQEDLKELSHKLEDVSYQNRYVIQPAINALLKVFEGAKDRITANKVELKEIEGILTSLEESIKKRIKELRKDMQRLRNNFNYIDGPSADEMSEVIPILIDLMNRVGLMPKRRLGNLSKTLEVYSSWLERYRAIAQKLFAKPVVPVGGAAFFLAVQSDNIAVTKTQLINMPLVSQNFESYIAQLERRINTILVPRLQKIIEFIRGYDNQFTIPISNSNELLPEVKELLSKLQNELSAEFKKEGIDLTKPLYG